MAAPQEVSMNGVPSLSPTLARLAWPVTEGRAGILRTLVLMVAGSVLLTLSAKIQVPFYPVPMTMQTLVVLAIGAAYGARLGAATVLLYLAEGLAGLPVFANTPPAVAGPLYFAGPTGGFLVGFAAAAFAVGWLAERGWGRPLLRLVLLMAIGHAVIFAFGLAWMAVLFGPAKAWVLGFVPFVLATILKTLLAAALVHAAWGLVRR
jgi:biotin transport system substrate-specific component